MVGFETDLVVVSAIFADPIEINLKEDEIWRKDVEKNIQNVIDETSAIKKETAEIKGNQDKMMKLIESLIE